MEEIVLDILLMIIGSFIGGLIGALTSLYFSRKSSEELQRETTRLRNLVNVLARYMHNEGVIRAEFDENRNLTQAVPLHGGVGAVGSFAGELTVGEDEPSDASDPDGTPDASAKPTATPDEVEVATALWNEYKHRHDLVWKIVFQVTNRCGDFVSSSLSRTENSS